MPISPPSTIRDKWLEPSPRDEIASSELSKDVFYAESSTREKIMHYFNIAMFAGAFAAAVYSLKSRSISRLSWIPLIYAARKIAAVAIGYLCHAATLCWIKDKDRVGEVDKLKYCENVDVKRITLNKSGVNYDAYLLINPKADNCKWTLFAGHGGFVIDEDMMHVVDNFDCVSLNYKHNLSEYHCDANKWHRVPGRELTNYLIVNGPTVGRSQGRPTPYQNGAAFEAGLQFLEKEIQATHIIMKGHCFGNGALAGAILQHDFEKAQNARLESGNPKINYLLISDRTFSRLSDIASEMVSFNVTLISGLVKVAFFLLGIELNCVEASKKLSQKEIKQIIIQHDADDGTISANVGLAQNLIKEKILDNKIFLQSDEIGHLPDYRVTGLPKQIQKDIHENIQAFLNIDSEDSEEEIDWSFWDDKGPDISLKTAFRSRVRH